MENYKTIIAPPVAHRIPKQIEFDCKRINVIMGANGIGKSTLLRNMVRQPQRAKKSKYIEGGRVITIGNAEPNDREIKQYGTYEKAEYQYKSAWISQLSSRLRSAIIRLEKKEEKLKLEYADAMKAWVDSGQKGPYPDFPVPPLKNVFDKFNEVFFKYYYYPGGTK